jgi:uncharacterized protein YqhQ
MPIVRSLLAKVLFSLTLFFFVGVQTGVVRLVVEAVNGEAHLAFCLLDKAEETEKTEKEKSEKETKEALDDMLVDIHHALHACALPVISTYHPASLLLADLRPTGPVTPPPEV